MKGGSPLKKPSGNSGWPGRPQATAWFPGSHRWRSKATRTTLRRGDRPVTPRDGVRRCGGFVLLMNFGGTQNKGGRASWLFREDVGGDVSLTLVAWEFLKIVATWKWRSFSSSRIGIGWFIVIFCAFFLVWRPVIRTWLGLIWLVHLFEFPGIGQKSMEAHLDPWINRVWSDLIGPGLFNGAATLLGREPR